MLADVSMLPDDLAIPVILAQQPASPANLLRSFRESAGPEQVSVVQQMPIHVWYWMIPLVQHLATQADQQCGSSVQRREESVTCGRSILITDMDAEITMPH